MMALRSLLFNIWFFGSLTVFVLTMWVVLPFPRRVLQSAVQFWAQTMLWGLKVFVGLDWKVTGRENIPEGGFLIASKHQSAWETFSLFVLFPGSLYVLKKELMAIPLWGTYARKAGAISVDRAGGMSALKQLVVDAKDRLDKGWPVIIFPEGTRGAPGEKLPYQPGIAALYQKANVPVLPVSLDSGTFWGKKSFLKKPGCVTVTIHEPIQPGIDRKVFMKTLEDRIESVSAPALKD